MRIGSHVATFSEAACGFAMSLLLIISQIARAYGEFGLCPGCSGHPSYVYNKRPVLARQPPLDRVLLNIPESFGGCQSGWSRNTFQPGPPQTGWSGGAQPEVRSRKRLDSWRFSIISSALCLCLRISMCTWSGMIAHA